MPIKHKGLFVPDFIIIPYPLIVDKKLQPTDRILFGFIYWYEHLKEGKCIASNQTLASQANISVQTVKNGLNRLEKLGYIGRDYKDKDKKVRSKIITTLSFRVYSNRYTGVAHSEYHIKNNIEKKDCAEINSAPPFNFHNQLKKMTTDKNRHIRVIAAYWSFKGMSFENKDQYDSALARELRPASRLKGYSKERIIDTMKRLNSKSDWMDRWTLETVWKYIDDPENTINEQVSW